jgi:hypothetical protein
MGALGDRPASDITTREVNKLLEKIASDGASASTVNKYRAVIVSIFNHGTRGSTFDLPRNPALATDEGREPRTDAPALAQRSSLGRSAWLGAGLAVIVLSTFAARGGSTAPARGGITRPRRPDYPLTAVATTAEELR